MVKKSLLIIGVIAAVSIISGCNGTTTYRKDSTLNRNWGRSYETAIYNQMVNPDADKNLEPVVNLDGIASEHNSLKYKNSFKKTESKEIINILKLQ